MSIVFSALLYRETIYDFCRDVRSYVSTLQKFLFFLCLCGDFFGFQLQQYSFRFIRAFVA